MSTAAVPGGRSTALPRPANPRPSVRVVPSPRTPARAPFIVVVLVILSLGLGALLLLNTLLAQGSFTLHTLNDRVDALADKEQALQQRASELAAPQRLARRAQELGMVPSQNPAFLAADSGKILGEPVPASAPIAPVPVIGSGDSTADSTADTAADTASKAPTAPGGGEASGPSADKAGNQDPAGGAGDGAGGGGQRADGGDSKQNGGDGGDDR